MLFLSPSTGKGGWVVLSLCLPLLLWQGWLGDALSLSLCPSTV